MPYSGIVESVDSKRGLRARLEGFTKREWVTDEDEWEWLEGAGGADGPRPLELMVGHALLRDLLSRLQKLKEVCAAASKGKHKPEVPSAKSGTKRSRPAGGTESAAGRKRAAGAGASQATASATDGPEATGGKATKRKPPAAGGAAPAKATKNGAGPKASGASGPKGAGSAAGKKQTAGARAAVAVAT